MRMKSLVALTAILGLCTGRPAAAGEAADVRAVIDRAIAAAGGEARLARFKAAEWTCKGTAHAGADLDFTDRCFAQWPEQFRQESAVEVKGQKFRRALILDAARGWIAEDRGTVDMNDAVLTELREKLHLLRTAVTLLPLTEKDVTLKPIDGITIDDRPAEGVLVTIRDRPDLRLYFDRKNGLLQKCERTVKDPLRGKVSEETFFSDYREAGGVQVARKLSVKRDGKPFLDWTVTEFQLKAKLDRGLFASP